MKLSKPSSIDVWWNRYLFVSVYWCPIECTVFSQVSKLVKPVEPDGQEIAFTPELLQHIEIKLDPTGSRGGTDSCKLAIYRRPSDGQYSAVVKFGRDGRYSESQSAQCVPYFIVLSFPSSSVYLCRHQLGQKAEAQRYCTSYSLINWSDRQAYSQECY